MLSFTMRARSAGPKLTRFGSAASTGMYCCGPRSSGRFGLSCAAFASATASSTIALRPASLKSRVDALPVFWPKRTLTLTLRSYWTRLTVIDELAQRVPERSPPLTVTSTASALAMLITLSVMALTCSREYMRASVERRVYGVKSDSGDEYRCGLSQAGAAPCPPLGAEGERE